MAKEIIHQFSDEDKRTDLVCRRGNKNCGVVEHFLTVLEKNLGRGIYQYIYLLERIVEETYIYYSKIIDNVDEKSVNLEDIEAKGQAIELYIKDSEDLKIKYGRDYILTGNEEFREMYTALDDEIKSVQENTDLVKDRITPALNKNCEKYFKKLDELATEFRDMMTSLKYSKLFKDGKNRGKDFKLPEDLAYACYDDFKRGVNIDEDGVALVYDRLMDVATLEISRFDELLNLCQKLNLGEVRKDIKSMRTIMESELIDKQRVLNQMISQIEKMTDVELVKDLGLNC